jgi:hypothetical protein
MRGTMIFFNEVKDHGAIRTEEGERLVLQRGGFLPGQAPVGRCAGLPVEFDVDDDGAAINISVLDDPNPRRARRRGR